MLCISYLVGYPPFSVSTSDISLNEQIVQGLYTFPDEFWSDRSDSVKDLIRKMMCINPNERLSIDDVFEHPWLADDHDNTVLVESILHPSATSSSDNNRKRTACNNVCSSRDVSTSKQADATPKRRPKRFKH
jgi:serine/threonine protein kinase